MADGGINKRTPPRESGGIPRVRIRFSLSIENEQADRGTERPNSFHGTKFSGANGDRERYIFVLQQIHTEVGTFHRDTVSIRCVFVFHTTSYF